MKPFFISSPIKKADFDITHQENLLLLGSCFTEHIGVKLTNHKFNVTTNPFGIIYHPISLANSLNKVTNNSTYSVNDLIQYNGQWLSFDHHGCFSSFSSNDCLKNINNILHFAHEKLKTTKTVIITFGTSWVYEHVEDRKIVANCHKIPSTQFAKRLLSIDEIVSEWSKLIEKINHLNFIFTVSPVRHINDGLHENNISKSVLHLSIHQLTQKFVNCHYFPAYEMVIDELRDYRFYNEDMIHPSQQAINYVWNKFSETYFNTNTKLINVQLEKIIQAIQHKPFNPDSELHKQFVDDQLKLVEQFNKQYPFLDLEEQKKHWKHFYQK